MARKTEVRAKRLKEDVPMKRQNVWAFAPFGLLAQIVTGYGESWLDIRDVKKNGLYRPVVLMEKSELAMLEARLKAAEAECKRLRHSHKSQRRRKFTPRANQI